MANTILVTRTSQPTEPVDFSSVVARVYTQISGAQLPSFNKEREANGLEPLVPNTKSDSPGSKPDKAFHFHLDVYFAKKAVDGRTMGDLITQKVDPIILQEVLKGLSYDNRFKSAAQDLWKTSNPTQDELNTVAQKVLETVPTRAASTDSTTGFPANLQEMIADLAPQFLRKRQVKNESGQLVDTDELVVDGKKFPVKEILSLSGYPTIQIAQTAFSCLGADKYRVWKQDQGTDFSKALDKEKAAKVKAEQRKEL